MSFPSGTNLSYDFVWNGRDGNGRPVEESKPVDIQIGYVYPAIYQTVRFGLREMGPVRAFKTLLAVNKKKGSDCQSCVLVPISSVADRSNTPTSKFVVISVAPAADAEAAAEDIRLAARGAV